jgi:hypothetical protein
MMVRNIFMEVCISDRCALMHTDCTKARQAKESAQLPATVSIQV